MIPTDTLLTIAIIFCILSSIGLLYMTRRFTVQKRKLSALNRELDMALRCLNGSEKQKTVNNFEADLQEAALKTKIDRPPVLKQENRTENNSIPERYRHVSTLTRHGLDNSEISAILQISLGEADQLIKLSRLTNQHIQ